MSKKQPPSPASVAHTLAEGILGFDRDLGSKWIHAPCGCRVYTRAAIRATPWSPRDLQFVRDIASIELMPECRNRGIATQLLEILEQQSSKPLYIENILNPHLERLVIKRGWTKAFTPFDNPAPSYWYSGWNRPERRS